MLLNLRSACVDTCIDNLCIKYKAMKLSVWPKQDTQNFECDMWHRSLTEMLLTIWKRNELTVLRTIRNHSFILRITVNLLLLHFHEKVYIPRNSSGRYYRLNASNMLLYIITCNKTGNYITSYALIKYSLLKER